MRWADFSADMAGCMSQSLPLSMAVSAMVLRGRGRGCHGALEEGVFGDSERKEGLAIDTLASGTVWSTDLPDSLFGVLKKALRTSRSWLLWIRKRYCRRQRSMPRKKAEIMPCIILLNV